MLAQFLILNKLGLILDLERLLILDGGKVFVRTGQLHVVKRNGEEKTCPLVDIAGLMLEGFAFDISSGVFQAACEYGFPVVFCNRDFTPACSLSYPATHVNHRELLFAQMNKEKFPLFKSLIERKILNQSMVLKKRLSDEHAGVSLYGQRIARELTEPLVFLQEAAAAKHYWKFLFEDRFLRVTKGAGDPVNSRLNFGYAITRSYLSRYIHLSGLHLGLGIGHLNAKNPFCLADDLIEPYRPIVDDFILGFDLSRDFGSPETKKEILGLLNQKVLISKKVFSFSTACRQTVLSYANVMKGKSKTLDLPVPLFV